MYFSGFVKYTLVRSSYIPLETFFLPNNFLIIHFGIVNGM